MPASDCMEHLAVLPSARLSVCSFHAHSSKRCILGLWLRQNTNSALCLFIFPFYSLNSDCMQCVLGLLWILSLSVSLPHGRPHIGANGVSWPPGKMDEKLKSENMQKRAVFYVYVIFWKQSGQAGVENGAMWPHIYSDILQNAQYRTQIFKIFFASGGKGALTP